MPGEKFPNSLNSDLKKFAGEEYDEVPPHPGIYAWYAKIELGKVDLAACEGFKEALTHYIARMRAENLKISAKASFQTVWTGELSPHSSALRLPRLEDEPRHVQGSSEGIILHAERTRVFLYETLMRAIPVFSSPVYLGASDNLKSRIRSHAVELLEIESRLNRGESEEHIEETRENRFAKRAALRGFSLPDFEIWILDLKRLMGSNSSIPRTAIHEIAFILEQVLNRSHRPLLGEQ